MRRVHQEEGDWALHQRDPLHARRVYGGLRGLPAGFRADHRHRWRVYGDHVLRDARAVLPPLLRLQDEARTVFLRISAVDSLSRSLLLIRKYTKQHAAQRLVRGGGSVRRRRHCVLDGASRDRRHMRRQHGQLVRLLLKSGSGRRECTMN